MARQVGSPVWYLDAANNVKSGLYAYPMVTAVMVKIAGSDEPISVKELNVFNTEVAAHRAQVNRAQMKAKAR